MLFFLLIFPKLTFSKKSIHEDHYKRVKPYGSLSGPMSGSDLGPNCLQSLTADVKSCGDNFLFLAEMLLLCTNIISFGHRRE